MIVQVHVELARDRVACADVLGTDQDSALMNGDMCDACVYMHVLTIVVWILLGAGMWQWEYVRIVFKLFDIP